MSAYYNEFDPDCAQWLRNLIARGLIAPGEVDSRDIRDVRPSDLDGFTQVHLFAGVGVWSYSARLAGWPDNRPLWTASCPCQPFSAAGKGLGFADERHLWPAANHLISVKRPPVIFGEQVASKNADPWIDLVQDDLEALDYAFGSVPFPSAGVGAPHIRDRNYWLADDDDEGLQRWECEELRERPHQFALGTNGSLGGMADNYDSERRSVKSRRNIIDGEATGRPQGASDSEGRRDVRRMAFPEGIKHNGAGSERGRRTELTNFGSNGGMADAEKFRQRGGRQRPKSIDAGSKEIESVSRRISESSYLDGYDAGPTNGFWRDADWLFCRDAKWRPVRPGTSPLAHGASSRVVRLRAYGNAINAEQAAEFITAYLYYKSQIIDGSARRLEGIL